MTPGFNGISMYIRFVAPDVMKLSDDIFDFVLLLLSHDRIPSAGGRWVRDDINRG
jgi:hypothetical protein